MSQQINLLLPALRPRRDWLGFPLVAGSALAVIVLVAGLGLWGRQQVAGLGEEKERGDAEAAALQQRLLALGQTLAARQPNPALQAEIDRLAESLRQREEALQVVESGRTGGAGGHALSMRGFARQMVDGVWLTGFTLAGSDVEIRGRLADAALLPHYIRRLNEESTFQGRRFAALDMQDASRAAPPETPGRAPPPGNARRYTEFVLHGSQGRAGGKAE